MSRFAAHTSLLSIVLIAILTSSESTSAQVRQSAEHRLLAREVGDWDAKTKFWMSPEGEPLESEGIETTTALGEYWIVTQFKSELGGVPFEGRGQFGYDPVAKKLTGTWIDTMSPYLNSMEGSVDESGEKLIMMSKGRDPHTGEESLSKMVTTYTDDDHRKFEMFGPIPGQEGQWWKMMEITYTRKK